MDKAIILSRVSSLKQLHEGDIHESQTIPCRRYAEMRGFEVVDEFEYVYSSTNEDESNLEEVYAYCKSHPEVKYLIIKCIDRISRG